MQTFQNIEYIQQLIAKHLRNELSNEESADLQQWLESSPLNKEKFEELTVDENLLEKLRLFYQVREGKGRVWQRIDQHTGSHSTIVWFRIAKVAAVFLVLIGAAAVWLWVQQNQKPIPRHVVQQSNVPSDLKPGTFKARLVKS